MWYNHSSPLPIAFIRQTTMVFALSRERIYLIVAVISLLWLFAIMRIADFTMQQQTMVSDCVCAHSQLSFRFIIDKRRR